MLYPSPYMAGMLFLCLVGFLLFLKHHLSSSRQSSSNVRLMHEDNVFNQQLISLIPQLKCNYSPPCWLKCSIIQTVLFGFIGRFGRRMSHSKATRRKLHLPDGTDITFDLYLDPPIRDPLLKDVMLLVVPGISSHSESVYIKTYTEYALTQGFKVACYNHHGSLPNDELSSEAPRFFTYGGTGDLSAMMNYLITEYPDMKYIGVGFSLGANILIKYLGEQPERQALFLAAQSWCQGYDAARCIPYGNRVEYGGFLFNYLLATRQRALISSRFLGKLFNGPPTTVGGSDSESRISSSNSTHSSPMCTEEQREIPDCRPTYAYRRRGRDRGLRDPSRDANGYLLEGWENISPFDIKKYESARNLMEFDRAFTCPLLGFNNPIDMYRWASSYYVMDKILNFPVLLVNARDDPLVPWWIVEEIIGDFCRINTSAVGVITRYGGHLGFYEGGRFFCKSLSWLDKVSIQHAKAITHLKSTSVSTF